MNIEQASKRLKSHLKDYIKTNYPEKVLSNNPTLSSLKALYREDNNPSAGVYLDKGGDPIYHEFSSDVSYSLIDLIMKDYNTSDYIDAVKIGCKIYNIPLEFESNIDIEALERNANKPRDAREGGKNAFSIENGKTIPPSEETLKNAHFYAMEHPDVLQHFTRRGLTPEIIEQYQLGYMPQGAGGIGILKHPEEYKYIYPYIGEYGYFKAEIDNRELTKQSPREYPKYQNPRGDLLIYNERYLREDGGKDYEVLFVVEGIYDALSIESIGYKAIATGGASRRRLIDKIKECSIKYIYIDSYDSDDAGEKFSKELRKEIDKPIITIKPSMQYKDFSQMLEIEGVDNTKAYINRQLDERRDDIENPRGVKNIYPELHRMLTTQETPLDTGLQRINEILGGGIYPNLYCIGAVSSLGKTTLILQICDYIASTGTPILYFSLETKAIDLLMKSLSRISYQKSKKSKFSSFKSNELYNEIEERKQEQILDCLEEYEETHILKNFSIYENPLKAYSADEIVGETEDFINRQSKESRRHPLVVIDFLQLLELPKDEKRGYTDKQLLDDAVRTLKNGIVRELNSPVIAINSFNRASYDTGANMESFKESGGIEYASDVLIGLEYEETEQIVSIGNLGDRAAFKRDCEKKRNEDIKNGDPIRIRFKVLKNRIGRRGECWLKYYPIYNYYEDEERDFKTTYETEREKAQEAYKTKEERDEERTKKNEEDKKERAKNARERKVNYYQKLYLKGIKKPTEKDIKEAREKALNTVTTEEGGIPLGANANKD